MLHNKASDQKEFQNTKRQRRAIHCNQHIAISETKIRKAYDNSADYFGWLRHVRTGKSTGLAKLRYMYKLTGTEYSVSKYLFALTARSPGCSVG